MIAAFERLIALRYLRSRRKEGFVSVVAGFSLAGIALGVATLIVVMSVMNGVKTELTTRIIGIRSHVNVYGVSSRMFDYDDIAAEVAKVPGVKTVAPIIEGQVMVSNGGLSSGAFVNGFQLDDLKRKTLIVNNLKEGSLDNFAEGDGVLIGYRMAEKLRLHAGDEITLIAPEGRQTLAGTVPRIKAYPVSGIFEAGMFEYDLGLVIMPFDEAQIYFKHKDLPIPAEMAIPGEPQPEPRSSASSLEVMVADVSAAPQIAKDIEQKLGARVRTSDWKQTSASLFQALAIQQNVMVVILMLIVLVASFNLISSLIMLVQGKGRDIAILRTMGISRASIQRIFILCGTIIGILGTVAGVLLGLLLAANAAAIQLWLEDMLKVKLFADQLYFFTTLPSEIHASDVIGVAATAMLLAFLATIYPARRAASLDPAEALRYE